MTSWTLDLPNQVVVTGTASGLGQECAKSLLRAGVQVLGVDVAAADPEFTAHAAYDQSRQRRRPGGLAERHQPTGGSTTLGYIGAASDPDVGVLETEDIAIWRRAWEINVLGNVLALKALLPQLKAAKKASVVVVTSVDAGSAEQQLAAYASSKAALTMGCRPSPWTMPEPASTSTSSHQGRCAQDSSNGTSPQPPTPPNSSPPGKHGNPSAGSSAPTKSRTPPCSCSRTASALFATTVTADGGLTASFDYRTGAEGSSA